LLAAAAAAAAAALVLFLLLASSSAAVLRWPPLRRCCAVLASLVLPRSCVFACLSFYTDLIVTLALLFLSCSFLLVLFLFLRFALVLSRVFFSVLCDQYFALSTYFHFSGYQLRLQP